MNLKKLGIELDEKKRIKVNEDCGDSLSISIIMCFLQN